MTLSSGPALDQTDTDPRDVAIHTWVRTAIIAITPPLSVVGTRRANVSDTGGAASVCTTC